MSANKTNVKTKSHKKVIRSIYFKSNNTRLSAEELNGFFSEIINSIHEQDITVKNYFRYFDTIIDELNAKGESDYITLPLSNIENFNNISTQLYIYIIVLAEKYKVPSNITIEGHIDVEFYALLCENIRTSHYIVDIKFVECYDSSLILLMHCLQTTNIKYITIRHPLSEIIIIDGIKYMSYNADVWQKLYDLLAMNKLEKLTLIDILYDNTIFFDLLSYVKDNNNLNTLIFNSAYLSNDINDDIDHINLLADIIENNNSLQELNFTDCILSQEFLQQFFKSLHIVHGNTSDNDDNDDRYKTLKINNDIDSYGIINELKNALVANVNISSLALSNSYLSAENESILAQAFKFNTRLHTLELNLNVDSIANILTAISSNPHSNVKYFNTGSRLEMIDKEIISEMIRNNKLKGLDIFDVDSESFKLIVDALAINTSLTNFTYMYDNYNTAHGNHQEDINYYENHNYTFTKLLHIIDTRQPFFDNINIQLYILATNKYNKYRAILNKAINTRLHNAGLMKNTLEQIIFDKLYISTYVKGDTQYIAHYIIDKNKTNI